MNLYRSQHTLCNFVFEQKLRDRPVIGADEFDRLQGAGDDDGISSISGSGSSDDEEDGGRPQGRGPGNPKIAFENADGLRMAVYRCLLHPKKVLPFLSFGICRKFLKRARLSRSFFTESARDRRGDAAADRAPAVAEALGRADARRRPLCCCHLQRQPVFPVLPSHSHCRVAESFPACPCSPTV